MSDLVSTGLHWLRPVWLLLLPLAAAVYWLLRQPGSSNSGWSRLIPAHLLTPLLPEPDPRTTADGKPRRISAALAATLAFVLACVALAGPVWRQAPSPAAPPADSLVIVLDLSLSMLATDVQPDRLTRAKRKIHDLLAKRQGSLTGLVVYAADAHSVTPLSDDSATLESMLSALDPLIMPAAGNRADLGVSLALDLLRRGAPGDGRILLVSDDVQPRHREAISAALNGSRFVLDTLTVGTRAGGPIPLPQHGFIREGERIVISQAAPSAMAQLAARNGGKSAVLTLDHSDLLALAPGTGIQMQNRASGSETAAAAPTRQQTQWQEDGYWLLWLALPLLLLAWRRGALALLGFALLPTLPQPAQALTWNELWQREDQRAPALIERDPQQAAQQLTTPQWQGTALYRSGDYDAASKHFARVPGANGAYNKGNALARAGHLEQAIAAYDQALALEPEHDDAKANRALVQALLDQQEQQQQNGSSPEQNPNPGQQQGQSQNGDNRSPSDRGQNAPDQAGNRPGDRRESPAPQGQQNGADSRHHNQDSMPQPDPAGQRPRQDSGEDAHQNAGESSRGGVAWNTEQAANGEAAASPEPLSDTREEPLSQSQQQYLRRIPDDPGGLLQQKFLQQYRQRQTPADEDDTPW